MATKIITGEEQLIYYHHEDLAGTALAKGAGKAFEALSNDMALSDKQKDIIGKILEGAIKAK